MLPVTMPWPKTVILEMTKNIVKMSLFISYFIPVFVAIMKLYVLSLLHNKKLHQRMFAPQIQVCTYNSS